MTKRQQCADCGFILVRCLCESLRPIHNSTHLIVLQHPSESGHALNTVALMKKSFQNITVITGEDFSENELLNSLIAAHQTQLAVLFPTEQSVLLKSEGQIAITHLILIDGTWKKARKMFLLSKNLHQLVSLKLETQEASKYIIRSSQLEHSLSTLEASISALAILEKELETKSLEETFGKMIEFQIEKMGQETFKKNYQKKYGSEE